MSSNLVEELESKEYRDAFVAAHVRNGVAFQVRAMREKRKWDQKRLAREMGNEKLQSVVSRFENPDYGRLSVSSLLELAKAFDVALSIQFVPFQELLARDKALPQAELNVSSFEPSALGHKAVLKQPLPEQASAVVNEPAIAQPKGKPEMQTVYKFGKLIPSHQNALMEVLRNGG